MKNIMIVIGIVLILALTACSNSSPTGSVIIGDVTEKPAYSFGGPKNIDMLPILADNLGFFEDYGLNMERNDIQTGKRVMDALIKGDMDFGVLVDSNIAFIKLQDDNPGIEVIAIIEEKFDDAIIAQKNRGIYSPEDLKGKRIGITAGTTSHMFALFYLTDKGINPSEVEFVNMPPPSIQAALINGNLDAGSIWQPYRYNVIKELGDDVVEFNDKEVYKSFAIIAVRKDFAQENPEVIDRFLRAIIEAEEYYDQHPDEVIQMMSEETDIPLDVLKTVWSEYILEISLKDELLDLIKNEGKRIIESEEAFRNKKLPDYEDSFNPVFLEKIDASRVEWD